jgi:hypothetical protein
MEEVKEPDLEQIYTIESLGNMLTWGDQKILEPMDEVADIHAITYDQKRKYIIQRTPNKRRITLDRSILITTEENLINVGTGADPGFSSKSAPTSPSYWPFRKHLRSRCSLTRSNYEGVAGQRCLQPGEYQVDLLQQQHIMHLSFNKLDLSFTTIDLI